MTDGVQVQDVSIRITKTWKTKKSCTWKRNTSRA